MKFSFKSIDLLIKEAMANNMDNFLAFAEELLADIENSYIHKATDAESLVESDIIKLNIGQRDTTKDRYQNIFDGRFVYLIFRHKSALVEMYFSEGGDALRCKENVNYPLLRLDEAMVERIKEKVQKWILGSSA